jgi:hypothetical protein
MAVKIRKARKTPRFNASDPEYFFIEVVGVGDAAPNSCKLKHKDWLCWVNPKTPGNKAFYIRFVASNPLKGLGKKDVIKVGKGAPSNWYQLKGSVKKGDRFEYTVSTSRTGPSQTPGPEIIGGD